MGRQAFITDRRLILEFVPESIYRIMLPTALRSKGAGRFYEFEAKRISSKRESITSQQADAAAPARGCDPA